MFVLQDLQKLNEAREKKLKEAKEKADRMVEKVRKRELTIVYPCLNSANVSLDLFAVCCPPKYPHNLFTVLKLYLKKFFITSFASVLQL